MKKIALYTKNRELGQKFRLILKEIAAVDVLTEEKNISHYDEIFIDKETFSDISVSGIQIGNSEECVLGARFLHSELIALVSKKESSISKKIAISPEDRCVISGNEIIKLTEVEYKLFSALFDAKGFIDRVSLLHTVWGDGTDAGVLNVYIHYLREKLEKNGEKIIISSRKEGYKIDNRYKGKE